MESRHRKINPQIIKRNTTEQGRRWKNSLAVEFPEVPASMWNLLPQVESSQLSYSREHWFTLWFLHLLLPQGPAHVHFQSQCLKDHQLTGSGICFQNVLSFQNSRKVREIGQNFIDLEEWNFYLGKYLYWYKEIITSSGQKINKLFSQSCLSLCILWNRIGNHSLWAKNSHHSVP